MPLGGTGAYGYGNVYRPYPQAQLQQVPPTPRVAVGPDAIRLVPPWEIEHAHWAAVGAATAVVYLVRLEVQIGGKFAPIPFPVPRREQWWPHRYDPPNADAVFAQFALPRLPPPPPPPLVAPWWAEVANWAALSAVLPVVYLVLPRQLQIGAEAVAFPRLGQWTPTQPSLDTAYYSLRQRLLPIVDILPITPAWAAELDHVAALMATVPTVYLARPDQLATILPVAVPLLGQWTPKPLPFDLAYYALRQPQLPIVPESPLVPAWLAELEHFAAVMATAQAVYLVRPDQVAVPPPPPLGIMPWEAERQGWAAVGATQPAVYLVALPQMPILPVAIVPALPPPRPLWLWYFPPSSAPYGVRLPVVVEAPSLVAPWLAQVRHWAALGLREWRVPFERLPLIFVPGLPPPVPIFEPLPAILKRFSSGGWGRLRGR